MTDNDDNDKRGGSRRGGGSRGTPGGRDGDRPRAYKPRGDSPSPAQRQGRGGGKPFRSREGGDERPRSFKPRGERSFGDRPPRGDGERKPFRPREGGDERPRAFKPRGERSFGDRPPRGDGERKPFRPREGGDERPRSFKPRGERSFGDRPPRGDGERKPFRPREGGDDRPRAFKPRGERSFGDRPPRGDGARKPFRSREDRAKRPEADKDDNANRIAKVIARAGLCSRRDAEAWIAAGRVAVNGVVIESPALDVTPTDKVEVDGAPLPARERTRLWLYHKPKGLETTEHSPEGRPTVFDNLPEGLPRVMSVGRLDINTEGLLLLTNDGGLARVLAHPKTAWLRRYRVRVHGPIDQAQLDTLRDGITLTDPEEGEVTYAPIVAKLERTRGDNSWLTMDLREGKNREIKKVLEHFGLAVTRLIRISFGPFQLGDMPEGTAEEIRGRYLRDQLGERLAAEAEADFEGPIFEHLAQAMDAPKKQRTDRPYADDRGRGRGFGRDDGDRRRSPSSAQGEDRGRGYRDRFEEDERPARGSPQDREGRSKTAWSDGPLPERRRDSKKPGQKRDLALKGERDDLRVTKEKVADRKGREVRVERVSKVPQDVEAAPDYALRDPNRRFGKRREEQGDRFERKPRGERSFGDRPPRRAFDDGERKPFRSREGGDDRPRFNRDGDKPFSRRREKGDENDRPRAFKPRGERSFGDRPPRRDFGDGERKPFRSREGGDERPRSFKPREDRGDRPMRSGKSFGDKPGGRTFGDKPFGKGPGRGGPGGKPGGRGGPGGKPGGRGGPGRSGPGAGPRGGGADRRR